MVDVKKRLEEAKRKARGPEPAGEQAGEEGDPLRPWSAKQFRVGNLEFQDLQVDGPADNEAFLKMARELGAGAVAAPSVAASAPAEPDDSPMLATEIEHHLADMERRKLAPDTITESRHTLRNGGWPCPVRREHADHPAHLHVSVYADAESLVGRRLGDSTSTGLLPDSQTPSLGVMMKPEVVHGYKKAVQSRVQA